MFTIYFIIGFILFCLACLEAIDDLTICDYRKQIKAKEKELKALNDEFDILMSQEPAVDTDFERIEETLRQIIQLKKEIALLQTQIYSYPRFYQR